MNRPGNATIKQALSLRFPAVRFSVRSPARSIWTHIGWTDGPTERPILDALAELGAAPGTVDQSDYFDGERVSCDRHTSDAERHRIAGLLLAPKAVPLESEWHRGIARQNCGGYYDLHQLVHQAASNREYFERCRFDAHAWLAAITAGETTAPRSVTYSVEG